VLRTCPGLAEYLDLLRSGPDIPVLGPAQERVDALKDMLDWTRAGAAVPPGTVIAVHRDSRARPVAEALAERLGVPARVLDGWRADAVDTSTRADGYVAVVALADELDLSEAAAVLRLAARAHPRLSIGFVVAADLRGISWMIAKGLTMPLRAQPALRHLLIDPLGRRGAAREHDMDDVVTISGRETSSQEIRRHLCMQRVGVVSIRSRGRDHAIGVFGGVICGAGDDKPVTPGPGTSAPRCAHTNECYRSGVASDDIIRADAVLADLVLSNSCMSWRPGRGLVEFPFQLSNAFGRGLVAAYVGALHPVQSRYDVNSSFHSLLREGETVGRAVAHINRWAEDSGQELPGFAVLGLPWLRAAGSDEPRRRIPAEPTVGSNRLSREIADLGAFVSAVGRLAPLGFRSQGLQEAADRCRSLAFDLASSPRLGTDDAELARLRDALAETQRYAVAELHEYAGMSFSSFSNLWAQSLQTRVGPTTEPCPACGRLVSELTGVHPLFADVSRRVLVCDRCHSGLDLPTASLLETLDVRAPFRWERGSTVSVTVSMRLRGDRPMRADVSVLTAGATGSGLTWPPPRTIELDPGVDSQFDVEGEVAADAPCHHQFVRVLAMVNGEVHATSRPVAVVPESAPVEKNIIPRID
jgi:hypothetical protein